MIENRRSSLSVNAKKTSHYGHGYIDLMTAVVSR